MHSPAVKRYLGFNELLAGTEVQRTPSRAVHLLVKASLVMTILTNNHIKIILLAV